MAVLHEAVSSRNSPVFFDLLRLIRAAFPFFLLLVLLVFAEARLDDDALEDVRWLHRPCHLNCTRWTLVGSGHVTEQEYESINNAQGCVAWFSEIVKGMKIDMFVARHGAFRPNWNGIIPRDVPQCPVLVDPVSIARANDALWAGGYLDPIFVYERAPSYNHPNPKVSPNARIFPGCTTCNDDRSACMHGKHKNGPSTGAALISYLQGVQTVQRIDTYGMTFDYQYGLDYHIDFVRPLVRQCCTKCVFHSVPTTRVKPEWSLDEHRSSMQAVQSANAARRDSLRNKLAALRQRPKPWIQHGRR
ncbi:hypothetical protein PPROV_000642000 [Pycnococcus provasolii]|uniref:Uncharacterized protein n=2 Tax=Pycnococcus provasolii TaxID=41880 RepID=A0A830HLD4_9CHLO|nr:hypothetical protein PPROV_000642000 [Pycnococcus provasolii]